MERRYYLVKVGVVVLAVLTAVITGSMNSSSMSHAITQAQYSAPASIEAAAWRTTAYIAHTIAHLLDAAINAPRPV
jgi:ABC-type enterobactin transport system permease subunit